MTTYPLARIYGRRYACDAIGPFPETLDAWPNVIDATVLSPAEVERRRRHDVEVFGNAFVLRRLAAPAGVECVGVDLGTDEGGRGVCVVVVDGRLPADAAARVRAMATRFGLDRPMSLAIDPSVTGMLRDGFARARESMERFGDSLERLRGARFDRIILDDLEQERLDAQFERDVSARALMDGCRDAFGLKVRDIDDPREHCARAPTPAEARLERKLAGPWHNPTPWKHTKKGGRR